MLPRIVVAADEDDALGALLVRTVSGASGPFDLEFCGDRGALSERLRSTRPAALVVGLDGEGGASTAELVEQLKRHYPRVPVLVAVGEESRGTDVLSAARAGAEHFAFSGIDDMGSVLRALVSESGALCARETPAAGHERVGAHEQPAGDPRRAPGTPPGREGVRSSGRWERIERGAATRLGPATWTRHRFLSRDRRRTPVVPTVLPPSAPQLLRRIVHACLGLEPLVRVDALAELLDTTVHSLRREMQRRGWPAPREMLHWGRLFRGAMVAEEARLAGAVASHETIARAGGYHSVIGAARGYRALAGVGLRVVSREGIRAVLPRFLTRTGVVLRT